MTTAFAAVSFFDMLRCSGSNHQLYTIVPTFWHCVVLQNTSNLSFAMLHLRPTLVYHAKNTDIKKILLLILCVQKLHLDLQ